MKIGIDAIAFDIPKNYISLADLAVARGIDPEKYTKGLGQLEMAVATPAEDTVVLAVGAAKRLFREFAVNPKEIGLVVVGTETAVDQSKPVAVYVHQLLGLAQECRSFEIKHACYGAMAGLVMASDWILSGRAKGKKALVIASDIARYGARTAGEPTQGAGAVALLVSENPRLLEIKTDKQGYFSKQVMDFWRPNYSKEAFADGHFSIDCYLHALAESYKMYSAGDLHFADSLAACLYHVPFVKMGQKAHIKLLETIAGKKFAAESPELAAAKKDHAMRVEPSLNASARVGNIYTGALFLSLLNLLDTISGVGQEISLFSYGSGSVAEYISARVVGRLAEVPGHEHYSEILNKRTKISIDEYEQILSACGGMDANGSFQENPALWNTGRDFVYAGCKDHMRKYFVNGELLS